jgi:hypothetical protein
MIDTTSTPQILEHLSKSLTQTVYDTKWVPRCRDHVASSAMPAEVPLSTTQMDTRDSKVRGAGVLRARHGQPAGGLPTRSCDQQAAATARASCRSRSNAPPPLPADLRAGRLGPGGGQGG